MASVVIHMAVAKEVNKKLNRHITSFMLGSIAPDIAKVVGEEKEKSHFVTTEKDIPNLDLFLNKYRSYMNNDFVLGYYVHLYTDYLWWKYFMPEIKDKNVIQKLDGTKVKCNGDSFILYVYNDYTNLNIDLINKYYIYLEWLFYGLDSKDNIIREIDFSKLNILIDKTISIIENTKKNKEYVFKGDQIDTFINFSTKLIVSKINEILS